MIRSLAREGRNFIFFAVASAVVVTIMAGFSWSWLLWLLSGLLIFLFRTTEREIPASPLGVVCPADGRVLSIAKVKDPYLEREAMRLEMQASIWGEYVLRGPIEGKIVRQWFRRKGELVVSGGSTSDTQASVRPAYSDPGAIPVADARLAIWIQTDEGDDVIMGVSVARWRPLRYYFNVGERVGQGLRCGFLPFGGRIRLFLPVNSRLAVAEGDRIRAGTDILAKLVHE